MEAADQFGYSFRSLEQDFFLVVAGNDNPESFGVHKLSAPSIRPETHCRSPRYSITKALDLGPAANSYRTSHCRGYTRPTPRSFTCARCLLDMGKSALEVFAVKKVTLPHFDIDERPQPLRVIGSTSHMFLHESLQEIGPEQAACYCTPTHHKLVEQRTKRLPEPASKRCGKPHLSPPAYRFRKHALHRFAEHVLGGPAAQLHAIRKRGRKFDQLVVQ